MEQLVCSYIAIDNHSKYKLFLISPAQIRAPLLWRGWGRLSYV